MCRIEVASIKTLIFFVYLCAFSLLKTADDIQSYLHSYKIPQVPRKALRERTDSSKRRLVFEQCEIKVFGQKLSNHFYSRLYFFNSSEWKICVTSQRYYKLRIVWSGLILSCSISQKQKRSRQFPRDLWIWLDYYCPVIDEDYVFLRQIRCRKVYLFYFA